MGAARYGYEAADNVCELADKSREIGTITA